MRQAFLSVVFLSIAAVGATTSCGAVAGLLTKPVAEGSDETVGDAVVGTAQKVGGVLTGGNLLVVSIIGALGKLGMDKLKERQAAKA